MRHVLPPKALFNAAGAGQFFLPGPCLRAWGPKLYRKRSNIFTPRLSKRIRNPERSRGGQGWSGLELRRPERWAPSLRRVDVIIPPGGKGVSRKIFAVLFTALFVICGPLLSGALGQEASSPPADTPDTGPAAAADPAPFSGNPELKARLDAPGKLTIAGERLHPWLLRPFYLAHGYQTVWDAHPTEASRLVRDAVLRAGEHGLDPALFHSVALSERGPTLSAIERDLLLSDAFLSYADALARGAMPIEERVDDEDLTPEPVDIVAVLDAALAAPDPAKVIGALAPVSAEYETMRRAYAEYRTSAVGQIARSQIGRG